MEPQPPPAPLPPAVVDEALAEARRRRRERVLILLTSASILLLVSLQILLSQAGRATLAGVSTLLVYGFININVILILFLLYLIIRNLVKLFLERRRRVLGSRLRTRLAGTFVVLSLAPTAALFAVAVVFVRSSINNWFVGTVETSLAEALEVTEAFYVTAQERAVFHARSLARRIADQRLLRSEQAAALEAFVAGQRAELGLAALEVWSARRQARARVADPALPPVLTDLRAPREGYDGVAVGRIYPVAGGDLVRGIAPIPGGAPEEVAGVVVASIYVPGSLVQKMHDIRAGFDEYKALKILKQPIKSSYVLTLLLVTLLILFSAIWFGFRLAKELTVPVQELVEGTRRVAEGDLDFRLEVRTDDELGSLVDSFNRMTRDLKESKAELTRANAELRARNLELDQRRAYMEIVLRNVGAGVVALDREGVVTTFNRAAERLLRLDAAQVVGRPYREAFRAEQTAVVRSLIQELGRAGTDSLERQVRLAVGPDAALTLLMRLTLLRDERGHYLGLVVVFEDLSEVIKAQRMSAWREVARRIAHEIKNPLTPIQLSAQRLRRRYGDRFGADGAVFDECTATIIKQVEELKALVNEFSNFARLPAVNPVPCDLNEVVQEALALYREAHRAIAFRFDAARDLPVVELDRNQIRRALINLLDNAVAAILGDGQAVAAGAAAPGGAAGEIVVTTGYDPELRIVRLEVADSGCGIPPEIRDRLFEPYVSTKKGGTGLGLAIVSTIIADHNGYIRVRDNQPRGTRFVIELPVRS
ncbi:MAG TPA: ATP-binding protein [Thermodesulfobacteriota bacterium]|nr:ATP-binding protein [Thermodesulfobacteriota bacterium]